MFKETKKRVIEYLITGRIQHESRDGKIEEKNLLAIGEITTVEVIRLISMTSGDHYSKSPHHLAPDIMVHVFKPRVKGIRWYIKCYFIEPNVWFISVHR